ncbi:hypothetical protein SOVF_197350 [Spinacia oleracea]|nr:hypothetical protein SOVF_197350 [Spinacia oleracea]
MNTMTTRTLMRDSELKTLTYVIIFLEVSMRSIFTGCEDVPPSISRVADSVGIDMPTFELLKYDPYDWIKRSQVLSAFANAFHALQPLKSTCFQVRNV